MPTDGRRKGRTDSRGGVNEVNDVGSDDGVGSSTSVVSPTSQPSIASSMYSSFSDQSGFMGDPMAATVTLLQLAQQRLKPGKCGTCLFIEKQEMANPNHCHITTLRNIVPII